MMNERNSNPHRFVEAIIRSGLSIYDHIEIRDSELWIPAPDLEVILDNGLKGISLADLPLRTRSKVVKQSVCRVLGYQIPSSFKKTQPRFPGQYFDTYIQKSNNLQIWNEALAPTRRYVLIRVSANDIITEVKVVIGGNLALLDTTGTLTQKFQASCIPGDQKLELVVNKDTNIIRKFVDPKINHKNVASPINYPSAGEMLPISEIFNRLSKLLGVSFEDIGYDQERNRGAILHDLICKALGYDSYKDDGQFPDIRHQLLEIKLQTSPTIDLGLVNPDSTDPLDVPKIHGQQIRHCDVRYVIFYAQKEGNRIILTHMFVTTGEAFFSRFPQFQGKILNKKLQIPLPAHFFER